MVRGTLSRETQVCEWLLLIVLEILTSDSVCRDLIGKESVTSFGCSSIGPV